MLLRCGQSIKEALLPRHVTNRVVFLQRLLLSLRVVCVEYCPHTRIDRIHRNLAIDLFLPRCPSTQAQRRRYFFGQLKPSSQITAARLVALHAEPSLVFKLCILVAHIL